MCLDGEEKKTLLTKFSCWESPSNCPSSNRDKFVDGYGSSLLGYWTRTPKVATANIYPLSSLPNFLLLWFRVKGID